LLAAGIAAMKVIRGPYRNVTELIEGLTKYLYIPHGNSTINYNVLPTCISDTTSHALVQEKLNDRKLGEVCCRHSDVVEEYLTNKKKKEENAEK
jgi:hypothetical protein